MPCGKRPLVKKWDKPKKMRTINPSKYEQNEASVKVHWNNVIKEIELTQKDDKFWESQSKTVQELVGPVIFQRLRKMFNLPPEEASYEPASELSYIEPSNLFYARTGSKAQIESALRQYSISDFEPSVVEESNPDQEQGSFWSESSELEMKSKSFKSKSFMAKYSKTTTLSKSMKSLLSSTKTRIASVYESPAETEDDLIVHGSATVIHKPRRSSVPKSKNPHFDMLYCNKSETDMIKWNSKYKQKGFEISASDELGMKVELLTKQITKEFYDWWASLGTEEYESDLKGPDDVEDLFQVLFDEHASRELVIDPKIMPCVLPSIAAYVGVPKASCPSVLKRQIAYDILAETLPAHKEAFGTCLPHKLKHMPPKNDTVKLWQSLVIPEDLKTMSAVWKETAHLTSTKSFHAWLQKKPHLPMAEFLRTLGDPDPKAQQRFVVPSDFVFARERTSSASSSASAQELALPVSQFTLELKDVLDKIMND